MVLRDLLRPTPICGALMTTVSTRDLSAICNSSFSVESADCLSRRRFDGEMSKDASRVAPKLLREIGHHFPVVGSLSCRAIA